VPAISPSHRYLLETPHTVAFATVGADGQPQVTAIWAMLDGDVVRTSLHNPDLEFLQRLLQLYGTDLDNFPAPTQERVVITLNPTRIVENG
jgi:hypothetical protein